jgi:hypothetical protein
MGMMSGLVNPPWKSQKNPGMLPSLLPNLNPYEAFKTEKKRVTLLTGGGKDDDQLGGLFGENK